MIDLKKTALMTAVGTFALVLSACSLYKTSNDAKTSGTDISGQESSSQSPQEIAEITFTFSDNGVNPSNATIKSGQAINWVNSSSSQVQIPSDPHPTHTDNRELANGEATLVLAPGASTTVTLTKKGTWGFHDH